MFQNSGMMKVMIFLLCINTRAANGKADAGITPTIIFFVFGILRIYFFIITLVNILPTYKV